MFLQRFSKIQTKRFLSNLNNNYNNNNTSSYLSKENITTRISSILSSYIQLHNIHSSDHFISKLHFDRLLLNNIIQNLSSEFCVDISYKDANKIVSIDTATEYFLNHPKAR